MGHQEELQRSRLPLSGLGSSPSGSRVQACSVGAENSPFLHLCYPLILRSTRIKDPLHCLIHHHWFHTVLSLSSASYPATVEASSEGETGRVGRETVIGIEVVDVELTWENKFPSCPTMVITFAIMSHVGVYFCKNVKLKLQPWCMWESMWQSWLWWPGCLLTQSPVSPEELAVKSTITMIVRQ